jgi:hypothetical protein
MELIPTTLTPENSRELFLKFESDLPVGERTLTISNVQTKGGFSIANNSQFTFTVFDEFEEGDIVISEFMYRPPDDYPRYVEIKITQTVAEPSRLGAPEERRSISQRRHFFG